ncbi:hypothetical protein ACFQZS_05060 [Mucilaginibacter calamicampi]|uniref:Uncharacterized protein n=1 Tax=Mucilaginibacter calamicampi TaxID=1302352 RepID=A0ABW2YST2_9SPHI
MKKLTLAAVIAFALGTLSFFNNSDCKKCDQGLAKSVMLAGNAHNILATAD